MRMSVTHLTTLSAQLQSVLFGVVTCNGLLHPALDKKFDVSEKRAGPDVRFDDVLTRSELLSEDEEPFEVLPGACIGPSLLVALHVLLAGEAEFQAWRGLEDALAQLRRSCRSASGAPEQAAAQPSDREGCATRGVAPGCGAKRKRAMGDDSGRGSCDAPLCCGGVRRHDEGLQNTARRRAAQAQRTEDARLAAAARHVLGSRAEERPEEAAEDDAWRPGVTEIAEAPLEPRARGVLGACIRGRLARYRLPDLAQDCAALAQEERRARSGRSGEGSRAKLAALRLVVTEKQLLLEALRAAGNAGPACP